MKGVDSLANVYFMTPAIAEYHASAVGTALSFIVAELTCTFMSVFGPLVAIIMVYTRAGGTLATPDALGWFTEDMTITLVLALYTAAVTYYFCVSRPGLTGHSGMAGEQYLIELISEYKLGSVSGGFCRRALWLYTSKLVIIWAAQVGGAVLAGWAFWACLNQQQQTNLATVRSLIDAASTSGADKGIVARTVLLSMLFMYFYAWSYDSLYRISPQGRFPSFARSPMYSFIASAQLVAFSRFIGVLVLFPITGSPMNFLVLLSLNILLPGSNYYAALTFFAGEMLGIAISFALSLLTIWATDWFHPKTGDGIFGLKTPKSLETETKA